MSTVAKTREVTFKAGSLIFEEKSPCHSLFIIKSGKIEIYRLGKDNQTTIPLGILSAGEYLGESAVLAAGHLHMASAIALTETVLIELPSEAINEQLSHAPPWLVALTKGLVQKLRLSNDIIKRNTLIDENLAATAQSIIKNELKKKA
jgi:CRP-like cAMP-binding protein